MKTKTADIIKVNEYFLKNKKDFNEEIGKLIKKSRIEKNISIKLFSERTMISESYIKQIESGKYGLTLSKFLIICNAIEISPYKIIDDFIFSSKENEDLFYNKLQEHKNISKNILNFMKEKSPEILIL